APCQLEDTGMTTTAIPALLSPPPVQPGARHPLDRRRSFAQLIGDSLRIYKFAFLPFFFVTLLVSVPILLLELTSPAYGIFPSGGEAGGLTRANVIALIAFTILIVDWPIFLAAIQIATLGALEGRKVRLGELLRRAANFFPRFAWLSVIVYGSYFFWSAIPVIVMLSIITWNPTIPAILLALLLLVVQVMMVARLFANFMFWQQSAVVSGYDGANAIREGNMVGGRRA